MIKPFEILTPVPQSIKEAFCNHSPQGSIGSLVEFVQGEFVWEDLRRYAIVLLGVGSQQEIEYLNQMRCDLYSLYLHSKEYIKIIDLGNIVVSGNDDVGQDRQQIQSVLKAALDYHTFIITLSASPKLVNDCYGALRPMDGSINISCISNTVDDVMDAQQSLLDNIGQGLFSLNVLAYQIYQTSPESLKVLQNHYCQTLRLGELRFDFKQVEPILRDTDILSFHLKAIRYCDAPATLGNSNPNGLYAEEACQLALYAGSADRLRMAAISGFDGAQCVDGQTKMLMAQLIWHLIDGYGLRKDDNPLKNVNGIKKYIVDMGAPMHQLVFYSDPQSDRWWMEVPGEIGSSSLLIACLRDDYKMACHHEVPLRWVWFHQKLTQKKK